MYKKLLLAALPMGIALANVAGAEDLMQIYDQARSSDPTLAAAESTKYATDEDVPIARAPLLPQLNASLAYLRDDNINRGVSPQLVTTETDPVGNYVLFPYST